MQRRLLFLVLAAIGGCHAHGDDGRSQAQRRTAAKTDEAAKQGALGKKHDPKAELAHQQANLARLQQNARSDREVGNRVGAWAAEWDARKTEKEIAHARAELESEAR